MKWTLKGLWKAIVGSDEEIPETPVDNNGFELVKDEEETELDRELEKIVVEEEQPKTTEAKPRPVCILVNSDLTVILEDGTEFSSLKGSKELIDKVTACNTKAEIERLMTEDSKIPVPTIKEDENQKNIVHNKKIDVILSSIEGNPEFEIKEGLVYFKGLPRALPKLLVARFARTPIDSPEYSALKNFWLWCVSNPEPKVAERLYGFLEKNVFRINKAGFFYALRNVVTVSHDKADNALIDAITNAHVKIKAWKKNVNKYSIYKSEDGEYGVIANEKIKTPAEKALIVGVVGDLYANIKDNEANRYTDAHTGTFDIRVGQTVSMPREQCAWTTADCNNQGLHFTLNSVNYVQCGDTTMLILINPAKVVGIGDQKGRCYEYHPIMTVDRKESYSLLRSENFDTLDLEDKYAEEELKDLSNKIETSFIAETTKPKGYKEAVITPEEVKVIVDNLSVIKDKLANRVVKA